MQANPFPFKRPVRVEMIPLIDMFFLLLVFFMFGLFYMSMQQGLTVDLPSAASAASTQEPEAVTITLTAEGRLLLNQDPVTVEALAARLRASTARERQALVILNADRQVPHGRVVRVLDAVRQAGRTRVSFQAEPEPAHAR